MWLTKSDSLAPSKDNIPRMDYPILSQSNFLLIFESMQSRMYLFFCENDIKVDLFIIAQKIVLFFNSYDNDLSLTRITF